MTSETESAGSAPRVIVVSLLKSGTHLIQELMAALGYGLYGHVQVPRHRRPVLDSATRWRLARMVYDSDELDRFDEASAAFHDRTDRAWEAVAWAWQGKLGVPFATRYEWESYEPDSNAAELRRRARASVASTSFAHTPANVCWFLPVLDVGAVDGRFLSDWSATGEPRIILNYRDPRDAVVSMVNFLSGATTPGFGRSGDFQVYSRILAGKPTMRDKLNYALSDSSFPGVRDFETVRWLLHHPDVCKISFEELVGPRGGGTAQAQRDSARRVATFCGLRPPSAQTVESLFRTDSYSFFRGEIGAWRSVFTADHVDLARRRFGSLLAEFGYDDEAAAT